MTVVTVRYDVVVVGAGPAGLAAAATAALAGCRVALLDAAARPGGQFWRHRRRRDAGDGHRDWATFAGAARSAVDERVDYRAEAAVWFVEPGSSGPVHLHTAAGRFTRRRLVLATGAYDRVVPFPGWDLPGVVTAGAAQALLKGSGCRGGQAGRGGRDRAVPAAGGGRAGRGGGRAWPACTRRATRWATLRRPGARRGAASSAEAAGYAGDAGPAPGALTATPACGRRRARHGPRDRGDRRRGSTGRAELPGHRARSSATRSPSGTASPPQLELAARRWAARPRLDPDGGLVVAVDGDPGDLGAGRLRRRRGHRRRRRRLAVVEGQLAGACASPLSLGCPPPCRPAGATGCCGAGGPAAPLRRADARGPRRAGRLAGLAAPTTRWSAGARRCPSARSARR